MAPRLPDRIRMEIACRYKAGETSIALGKEYGIHSAFVRTIFQRSGLDSDRERKPHFNARRQAVEAALQADKSRLDGEIANEVGCSRAYVVMVRRSLGIYRARACRRVALRLSEANATAFHQAATVRGISIPILIDRIIDAIATDRMFDAVLDDRSEAA